MTTLKSDCRKFAPNIFNKSKCQNCFRTKEAHSAEALESNRCTRKVSKCGYLFVAPDWDFSVSINRTKRWQRRWFVLYDDGELTYSVDEHPDTVPQAVIDMNKVLEVSDAQEITGNQFAIAITAPEKVHFVKGTCREESRWWYDVLSRLPRNNMRLLGKHKRNATFPGGKATTTAPTALTSDQEIKSPETYCTSEEDIPMRPRFTSESIICQREDDDWADWLHHHLQEDDVFPIKECNINSSTPSIPSPAPAVQNDKEDEPVDNNLVTKPEDLKEKVEEDVQKKARCRRYQKRENRNLRSQRSRSDGVAKMIPTRDVNTEDTNFKVLGDTLNILGDERPSSPTPTRRRHTSDKVSTCDEPNRKTEPKLLSDNNFSISVAPSNRNLKKSESLMNIASELSPELRHHITELKRNHSYKGTVSRKDSTKDSKDSSPCNTFIQPVRDSSSKPAVVSSPEIVQSNGSSTWDVEVDICTESMVLKKGWLLRRPTLLSKEEWSRHWFVLKNASFTYYRDPSAEDCGILDGVLDLNQVTSVEHLETEKHFAFSLIMWDNKKYILATESSVARSSWVKAIQCASNLWDAESRRDFSNDEIVLPEHSFSGTGSSEKVIEQTQDLSSSDDQSEYFSIIDDGEEEAGQGERPSSPRTLPPSPPLNRTAMSLVKERARGRSNSYSCASVTKNHDEVKADHNTSPFSDFKELSFCNEDSYKDICARLLEVSLANSTKKEDSSTESLKDDQTLTLTNTVESSMTNSSSESHQVGHTAIDSDVYSKQKCKHPAMSDSCFHKMLRDNKEVDDMDSDTYKIKYELLKSKYLQERNEWEERMKQDGSLSLKANDLSSYIKVLQKTKRAVNELKEKFCSTSTNNSSVYVSAAKDLQQLCKEIEKLSPCSDKRLRRDADVKKWRKGFSEMQVFCKNQQQKLQEVQSLNASFSVELKKRERTIEELQQEICSLRKEQFLLQPQKSQDESLNKSALVDTIDGDNTENLFKKLRIAEAQIRRLQKDLKDSHRSLDDLEIYCFQLKQDMKGREENHLSQMSLMTARVDDLTAKLTVSERSLRQLKQKVMKLESKQERRRSSLKSKESISLSKEYESKLIDLEQKLTGIENELKSNERLDTKEDISSPLEYDQILGKRLSQDSSSSSSENAGSLFLRLHSLGLRTKAASEAVKKQVPSGTDEVGDIFDKPKICLQIRHEGEISGQDEEEEECGEDWSTLSYTTSLTDLQTFDGLDSCDFPSSWSDIIECLEHKVDNLLLWAKLSLQGMQKQDSVDNQIGSNADFSLLTSSVLEMLDNLSDIKMDAGSSTISKVCYKMLLLNDLMTSVHNIVNFESCHVLEKLCVGSAAFKFLVSHLHYSCDPENQASLDVSACFSLVEKLLSLCHIPYDIFLNDSLDDYQAQVSLHSPYRISLLHQNCSHLINLLDEAKSRHFSAIMQTLADIPVQDPEVNGRISSYIEDCQEMDALLLNIITTVNQFYKVAGHQISQLQHQHNLGLLHFSYKAWNKWTHSLQKDINLELCSVTEELKKAYPQVREKNVSSCSLSDTLYKKIIHGSIGLARVSLLRAVAHSVLNFLSEETASVNDSNDIMELANKLREQYLSKAVLLSQNIVDASCSDSCEGLHLSHIIETGLQEIKMEAAFHDLHQKKIASCAKELDILTNENAKLKGVCEANKAKLQELQDKLEQVTTKDYCDNCHALETKLLSMKKLHEADLFALDRKCKEKMEEIHKHLQLVLEQKDEIHLQEVQKLEEQLQAAQDVSSRVEMEYSQQVEHLKELYQQKVNLALDPINEESVRRRYQSEIEQLKDLWEKGLTAVQNSYKQMTMEMDRRHKQELSLLEAEKEKVLKEEAQATITALEVMRKYHAEELQREVARCREEILRKMHPNDQHEEFYKRYEKELEEVKREIMLLSEKFSVKCLENASLEEKVKVFQQQLQETNHQLIDLTARNKQLKVHLAIDIAEMKRYLSEREDPNDSLENLKILLKLKENEIAEQIEENAQSKQELHLAQMHVSVLDVQCEQLYHSLNAERKLREDEVSNLRSRLEAIITASLVHADDSNLKCTEGRGSTAWSPSSSFLCRTPSLNLIPNPPLDKLNLPFRSLSQANELLRSSWPGLECSK